MDTAAGRKPIGRTTGAPGRGFEPTGVVVGSNPPVAFRDMAVAPPPAGASNGELVRWSFRTLNERDVEPLRQSWTQATVERFPSGTIHGADAMAGYFQALFDALPDFHMQVVAVAEAGDDVFVHWHLTGTHSGGRLEGIEPTGRAIAIDGMDHFVIRDGTIATNFVVFDQMQFARQLGMLPADGSPADRAMKAAFNVKTRLLRRLRRLDG
jgi:predicted ester cyclase